MEREIDKILNIPSTIDDAKAAVAKVQNNLALTFEETEALDPRFNEDFEITRDTLRELLGEVKKTVYQIGMVAHDTEKADHYAAMAQMATVLMNINKQLLNIYEVKKKYLTLERKEPRTAAGAAAVGQVNGNVTVFTGTTADLKKWIEDATKKEDIIDVTPSPPPDRTIIRE